ncbi:MAG: hypothetical protein E6230_16020 [Paenibacillus dendritiformis]|uniref:hypothetical protein n=1 Tax=uncultured Paenibacillus sp. TaxID=227322 RepID=UPI0025DD5D78|nr:hypothetical protein [uncultured Paenibacillus sp.]MDU5143684.1 hypothetical protein [Paenibacillus dendritiformis]
MGRDKRLGAAAIEAAMRCCRAVRKRRRAQASSRLCLVIPRLPRGGARILPANPSWR